MTQIWTTAIDAGSSSSAVATAKQQVTANSAAIASQMRSINSNAGVYSQVILYYFSSIVWLTLIALTVKHMALTS